ncbi:ATP synthase F1 subcomplex gamma subunit [Chitinophaga jiangningensis]|uniref:ATP synthase gamma chain n=1 Tax=Chitinophaga jiangningensis TaxID=1419482 RepID=A0A1M6WS32_9BACT|nr:ATP synthase F1 subunit gamma [Chitinophaga jiangningensis]SHK96471.1 ATP synthase F1 subcomplex gamma subunit [Chitinophaga jiangningensis]
MSGQLKEVRNRIKSIQSGQQITKAMKMVSAAKLKRAQDAILLMRPYALKLQEMLQNIVTNSEGNINTPLAAQREIEKVLIVVITSDRGLCGAFNSNLIKAAKRTIREKYAEQFEKGNVEIMPIGKKGYEHFLNNGYKVDNRFWQMFGSLTFEHVKEAAEVAMTGFIDGTYDAVEIVYSEFKNAAVQEYVTEQFLPIAKIDQDDNGLKADYIFEPEKDVLIAELMPKILNTQFFKAILDSHASEHGARMTAMDKATENAAELLRNLKISYNRARQAAITTELTEIVSGAAALAG